MHTAVNEAKTAAHFGKRKKKIEVGRILLMRVERTGSGVNRAKVSSSLPTSKITIILKCI